MLANLARSKQADSDEKQPSQINGKHPHKDPYQGRVKHTEGQVPPVIFLHLKMHKLTHWNTKITGGRGGQGNKLTPNAFLSHNQTTVGLIKSWVGILAFLIITCITEQVSSLE